MNRRLLALSAALVAGLFAMPLPASAGPITCPSNGLCIDESVEGQNPTVTIPSAFSGTITTSVVPVSVTVGEAWNVSFTSSSGFDGFLIGNFRLIEPGSGSVSDSIPIISQTGNTITYQIDSDNDLGQINDQCTPCNSAIEDGTFQFTGNEVVVNSTTLNVFLKSDLDVPEVPEPASLALLGTALLGFGVIRRRRRVACGG